MQKLTPGRGLLREAASELWPLPPMAGQPISSRARCCCFFCWPPQPSQQELCCCCYYYRPTMSRPQQPEKGSIPPNEHIPNSNKHHITMSHSTTRTKHTQHTTYVNIHANNITLCTNTITPINLYHSYKFSICLHSSGRSCGCGPSPQEIWKCVGFSHLGFTITVWVV